MLESTLVYWAVVFTSRRRSAHAAAGDDAAGDAAAGDDAAGYAAAAQRMLELAAQQPGFLGVDSVRDGDGLGITVSYWDSPESITVWRRNAEHTLVREQGRSAWYERYEVRVARVEREYSWDVGLDDGQDVGLSDELS